MFLRVPRLSNERYSANQTRNNYTFYIISNLRFTFFLSTGVRAMRERYSRMPRLSDNRYSAD